MSELAPGVDLLTAAWKRELFEAGLARAVHRARAERAPLSVIHIDVDDLQEHNDVHGEAVLDQTLSWLASKIAEVVDGKGPIGRVEGDEFAVFLSDYTLDRAQALAERIRRAVPRTLHASAFGDYRLTVSVGVATLRAGEPWGNLFEAAERACLRAKQGGRDAVVCR